VIINLQSWEGRTATEATEGNGRQRKATEDHRSGFDRKEDLSIQTREEVHSSICVAIVMSVDLKPVENSAK
jgi:hypothetical protein